MPDSTADRTADLAADRTADLPADRPVDTAPLPAPQPVVLPGRAPDGGDLVLDVRDLGPQDGPAVVLLHGFPQDGGEWAGVWPALVDAGHRVVVPDQRGYSPGARPEEVEAYRVDLLAGDVLALLDALGLPSAHVVGHDWGAAVTWHLAGTSPDRVLSATAVSVPHPAAFSAALRSDPDQRERSQYMLGFVAPDAEERLLADDARWLREALGDLPDADRYLARVRQPGALSAALAWYRAQYLPRERAELRTSVPVLHVWSDADPALGPVATLATASHVDGPYRLEVLAGVDHWVPDREPDALAALLLEHLRSVG